MEHIKYYKTDNSFYQKNGKTAVRVYLSPSFPDFPVIEAGMCSENEFENERYKTSTMEEFEIAFRTASYRITQMAIQSRKLQNAS